MQADVYIKQKNNKLSFETKSIINENVVDFAKVARTALSVQRQTMGWMAGVQILAGGQRFLSPPPVSRSALEFTQPPT
jgi:hypothetical protein